MSLSQAGPRRLSSESLSSATFFELAGHRVEPSILRITGVDGEARLEAKVMLVLVYLVENAGRVVSRTELEEHIWPGRVVSEDAVSNTIRKLRRALGDDARHPHVIETVPKIGYRLIAEVETLGQVGSDGDFSSVSAIPEESRSWRPRSGWFGGVFLLLLLLVAAWILSEKDQPSAGRSELSRSKPAVAILPFENLAATPERDYFANGFTTDLITDLSKVSGLLVIAPGSVFAYKDSAARPSQISAELNVDYVVVGSVQRSGERLRVNVQLIEASSERAVWGERYERTLNELFAVQDTLAAAVIEALQVELAPFERESLASRQRVSMAAYDYYLRGLEAHGQRSRDQNLSAREHFLRAIGLAPTFARAYSGLALTYSREAIDGWVATPLRSLERAAELADTAARMDPFLPQVHFVTGQVELFRRHHAKAIEAAQRAVRVDPNYADAYALGAWILNYAGRPAEAQASMEKAMRLNPKPTASYLEVLGEIRFVQGRYGESVSVFEQVLEINPSYARARMWIAASLAHAGSMERAEWEAAELLMLDPNFSLKRLEFAFPFKDPGVMEAALDGLKRAGLPD